jgi:uracil DNA glycosylase
MSIAIHDSWKKVLESEFQQSYFTQLTEQVRLAYIEHKGSVLSLIHI